MKGIWHLLLMWLSFEFPHKILHLSLMHSFKYKTDYSYLTVQKQNKVEKHQQSNDEFKFAVVTEIRKQMRYS